MMQIALGILFSLIFLQARADEVSGDISPFGDATHVEFQGRQNWDYDVRREGRRILVSLPKLNEETLGKLKLWSGDLVEKITVEPGDDNGHEISFHLKNDSVDSFDYLTDQPSRLVIDFFKAQEKSKEKLAQKTELNIEKSSKAAELPRTLPAKKSLKESAEKSKGRARTPASEILLVPGTTQASAIVPEITTEESLKFGIFDGGDPNFSRFEIKDHDIRDEAIIASHQKMYLNFPRLEIEPTPLKEIWASPPIYEIKPEDTDENKKARLLLTLFNKKRFAVYLKSLEFFEKDYPNSKYREIVKYLEADVYYELWKSSGSAADFGSAISRYQALVEEFPKSPLAERTSLLIGYSFLDRGDHLGALKSLQRYTNEFKNSVHTPRVKLAIADSMRALKSYSDALRLYEELESNEASGASGTTAAFKRGDVFFQKGEYPQAIEEYQRAIKKYPKDTKNYPNAFYNMAEAMFQLKKYREGLVAYRDFLNRFPRHAHGGYAMTRIGELLEIMGADPKKVTGAYLESIFRYKGSVGAGVARLRILTERLPEMKSKEVETALEEIRQFAKTAELPMVQEFGVLMTADGLSRRKEFRKALGILAEHYRSHPLTQLDMMKNRIVSNVADLMRFEVDQGKFLDALKTYGEYSASWLKNSDRIDVDFYLGQSFEKSSLYKEAAQHYRKALNNLYAIKGTDKEKEKKILEHLPQPEELLLRLASISWSEGDTSKTYEYLEDIKDPARLSPNQKVERVELAARVAIAKGQAEPARKFLGELVETWKGQPARVAQPLFVLAELDTKAGRYKEANVSLEKILHMNDDSEQVEKDLIAKTLQLKARNQISLNDQDAAIKTHEVLLEKFEESHPLESYRYQLGLMHFKKGRVVEAEKVWSTFKPDTVWSRLAKEQMNHSKWKNDYKKYIQRIPAMAGERKENP